MGEPRRVGQSLALLQGCKHHNADAVHGRRHRLECSHPWRRADVRGFEESGPRNGTGGVSRRAPRFEGAVPYQRPSRTQPELVRTLRQSRRQPATARGEDKLTRVVYRGTFREVPQSRATISVRPQKNADRGPLKVTISHACATFCIRVPMLDVRDPIQTRRKLRWARAMAMRPGADRITSSRSTNHL